MDWARDVTVRVLSIAIAIPYSTVALPGGLAPWQFGMSKEQVASYTDFGPYVPFKNGDIETYNGVFEARKENVQFFFDDTSLRRIGVYEYEGTNLNAAEEKWRSAYEAMTVQYGRMEAPTLDPGTASLTDVAALAAAARKAVDQGGKIQMAPAHQPTTEFVFSSFYRYNVNGTFYYYVVAYLDRPKQ